MKFRLMVLFLAVGAGLSGCAVLGAHPWCAPNCQSQHQSSSSLVSFLYPNGRALPSQNAIPELRLPLRVGLAFLPSANGATQLDAAHKAELLDRIRAHFADRKFVSDIVIVPDYYLAANSGYTGLEALQRLYAVDVMALVSYDQVTHQDDNGLSLGYLTIVGAFVLPGNSHEVATLVDLAVVDPVSRSLVLRAGGVDRQHGNSTFIDKQRVSQVAAAKGFDTATAQMIGHFDTALSDFEASVRAGKANVRVVSRNASAGSAGGEGGGGGDMGMLGLCALLSLAAVRRLRHGFQRPSTRLVGGRHDIAGTR